MARIFGIVLLLSVCIEGLSLWRSHFDRGWRNSMRAMSQAVYGVAGARRIGSGVRECSPLRFASLLPGQWPVSPRLAGFFCER